MDVLTTTILDIRRLLREGVFTNEDHISKQVVMRLLESLGWNVFDPKQVRSEFRVETRRVDYALLREPFGAVVLIEVKYLGKASPRGEEQLFEYCVKQGVPLAVLTDGRYWHFYLPAGSGSYEQRRFAVVDLVDDHEAECSRVLKRYLEFDAVALGLSDEDARGDYQIHHNRIVAREQFAPVLESLIAQADTRVVALFCDMVEERCGTRPDEGDVERYLRSQFPRLVAGGSRSDRRRARHRLRNDGMSQQAKPPLQRMRTGPKRAELTFGGQTKSFETNRELLFAVFETLAKRDPTFCKRYGEKRVHLRRRREDLSPRHQRYARQLPGGWWLGTHGQAETKYSQVRTACEVAGFEYGRDLTVHLRTR